MEKLLKTYGFDLAKVIEDARANGLNELADVVETQVANLQACYDTFAERHTSCGGEDVWKVDVEYLKGRLR